LRASKLGLDTEMFEEGVSRGKEYARNVAEVIDLEIIEVFVRDAVNSPLGWCPEYWHQHQVGFHTIPQIIFGDKTANTGDFQDWWEAIFRADSFEDVRATVEQPHFLYGFCEGAMEVWNGVKDHI